MRDDPSRQVLAEPGGGTAAREIMEQLAELRARCQRYTGSVVTPMGDEMFYRYQESLIDELTTKLAGVPTLASAEGTAGRTSAGNADRPAPASRRQVAGSSAK